MAETVILKLTHGNLRGQKIKTEIGKSYYSFYGIPYAKPPVGPLRFQAPVPAEPWEGIRDASEEPPIAPQFNYFAGNNDYMGQEDCLYINVFTPKLPGAGKDALLPVLVYIHGGGFFLGSGNKEMHGPGRLMNTQEVVLVTMNYRLGALGFLSTGDDVIPGNNGLKDQVLSLKWVQKHISQFGGDPNNVTIGGVSAGAGSVHLLVLSQMGKGLFKRGIMSSGSALCSWAAEDASVARKKAFRFGEALGCKTTDSKELLDFLMKLPANQFVDTLDKYLTEEEKHPLPIFFLPVIEKQKKKEESFLSEKPIDIIRQGKFNKVPLMIGLASREGLIIMRDYEQFKEFYESMKIRNLITSVIDIKDKEKLRDLTRKVEEFYFDDKPISDESLPGLVDLYGDLYFNIWSYQSILEHQAHLTVPIYFYMISHSKNFDAPQLFKSDISGANHGADLSYLFETLFVPTPYIDAQHGSMITSEKMLKLWTNFSKTGNPTPIADESLGVTWKPVTKTEISYLNIDSELSMKKDFMKKSMEFWDKQLQT